jgi:hypothetical protein
MHEQDAQMHKWRSYQTTPRRVGTCLKHPDAFEGDCVATERGAKNVAEAPRECRVLVVVGDACDEKR